MREHEFVGSRNNTNTRTQLSLSLSLIHIYRRRLCFSVTEAEVERAKKVFKTSLFMQLDGMCMCTRAVLGVVDLFALPCLAFRPRYLVVGTRSIHVSLSSTRCTVAVWHPFSLGITWSNNFMCVGTLCKNSDVRLLYFVPTNLLEYCRECL